jgi:hypothetical protein
MTTASVGYISPRLDGAALVLSCPNGRGGELAQAFTPAEAREFLVVLSHYAHNANLNRRAVRIVITDGAQSASHDLAPDDAAKLASLVARIIARAERGARDLTGASIIGQRD